MLVIYFFLQLLGWSFFRLVSLNKYIISIGHCLVEKQYQRLNYSLSSQLNLFILLSHISQ